MKRADSIEAVLLKARQDFIDLKRAYELSLREKTVREDLKVEIKNIFENLRSCLDYIAHDVFEGLYPATKTPDRLYFPIRQTRLEFDQALKRDYPNIENANKAVYDLLEAIQPYHDQWLGQFNRLNNDNKHQDLVEQTRSEAQHVTVSRPGVGSVSWSPGVTFSGNVSVMGVPIDPKTQLPIPNNLVKTEVVIWVDFRFKDNGLSVLPFIETSLDRVETIFREIQKYI
jgi:hypothetical protein